MIINIASTHRSHHILLVYEKEVLHVSGTYHSSSTDVYQLSDTVPTCILFHMMLFHHPMFLKW
jgi:hypothetical protein